MKKNVILLLFSCMMISSVFSSNEEKLVFGTFGEVTIYRSVTDPATIVLFVSGDGGWNEGVVDMAKILSSMNTLVVGIDIVKYYANLRKTNVKCYYPASDFENLSIFVQKKLAIRQYRKPILVGYSSGATLVYGLLAQAPANTFKGAVALGFCPDIEINRPLCEGSGLKSKILKPGISYDLEVCENLSAPLIVLQGMIDQVCDPQSTGNFIKRMKNADIISLPKVGHGFSVQKNWVPQFKEAFQKIVETPALYSENKQPQATEQEKTAGINLIADLPVIAVPAEKKDTLPMILLISGDGGWTGWDHSLAQEFSKRGYPVAGLDSQKYFWEKKDPEKVTEDVSNILKYYSSLWNKKSFLLIGYSFGADVVPFVATRLKSPFREQLRQVVMMSPDPKADFEIHIADMLNIGGEDGLYNVPAEVKSIKQTSILCIFGETEDESDKQSFRLPHIRVADLPGSHHYSDNFVLIVETILKEIKGID